MSGFVGLLNLDGTPVNRALLGQMTEFMRFRGPDAQDIWLDGPFGLGRALLRTTWESKHKRQPWSLDGQVWITADARVDAREELIGKLGAKGSRSLEAPTDAELILHAYHVWGANCLEHLLGDFSFAIWDRPRWRLFCARDHFGVKPFYYARVGDCLVFSNTLNCVRLHPRVSDRLNDQAIGDFLLFDFNQDPATTSFADIERLPAAHCLTYSEGALRTQRYWTLPVEGPIHYKRATEYVEHFRELLSAAIEDRLRADRVAVFISGGLDSTTVAAIAKEAMVKKSVPLELRGYTTIYEHLIPDQERYYTGLAAQALGIPVEFYPADNYRLYERWDRPDLHTPEPYHGPLAAADYDQFLQVALQHHVALTGYGADPVLSASLSSHVAKRIKDLRFALLAADLGRYLMAEGRLSRLYVRTRLRVLAGKNRWRGLYPTWLNEEFSGRLNLPARWEQINSGPVPDHPVRPLAYQAMITPFWASVFENYDPGAALVPVETRHPFFDVRLVRYLLRLPALPWCADKELLRVAMRDILPEQVRLRRKSPMAADPVVAAVRRGDARRWNQLAPAPGLTQYVRWDHVPGVTGKEDSHWLWLNLRPISFNLWLQADSSPRYKPGVVGGEQVGRLAFLEDSPTEGPSSSPAELVCANGNESGLIPAAQGERRGPLTDKADEKTPAKKAYRSPELQVYGDIREITLTLPSGISLPDGAHDSKGHALKTG